MLVQTEEQYDEFIAELNQQSTIVFDLETQGLDPYKSGHRMIGIAVAFLDGRSWYIPFRHKAGTNIPIWNMWKLAPFFADMYRTVIGWNVKFDVNFVESDGIKINANIIDAMVMAHLSNENEQSFALKKLGDKYIGKGSSGEQKELEAKLKALGVGKGDMGMLPPEDVGPYAEQDVILTLKLFKMYTADLTNQGIIDLAGEFSVYTRLMCDIEQSGIMVDVNKCVELKEQSEAKVAEYAEVLRGYGVQNPNSNIQLAKAMGVKSTAKEILESMPDHPLTPVVRGYRKWNKSINTYYDPFMKLHDSQYRLHPNFRMTGTVTGRLSCSDPNLQAIPRSGNIEKDPLGIVKSVFIAPPGFTLVSFDYSQAELRMLAQYTQDPFLLEVYRSDKDIHSETATTLNIPRDYAKRINFGIVYGIGKVSLAQQIRSTEEEADSYLKKYHKRIPGIKKLYKACESAAIRDRCIHMWTGRMKHIMNPEEAHKGMSYTIQGGVGELMRITMTRLYNRLIGTRVRMILQIHDDIVFEVPDEELHYWLPEINSIMQDFDFDVPVIAEGKYGKSWGAMEKWKPEKEVAK